MCGVSTGKTFTGVSCRTIRISGEKLHKEQENIDNHLTAGKKINSFNAFHCKITGKCRVIIIM